MAHGLRTGAALSGGAAGAAAGPIGAAIGAAAGYGIASASELFGKSKKKPAAKPTPFFSDPTHVIEVAALVTVVIVAIVYIKRKK